MKITTRFWTISVTNQIFDCKAQCNFLVLFFQSLVVIQSFCHFHPHFVTFFGFFSAPRAFFPPIWWFLDWYWSFRRARMNERERNRGAGKIFCPFQVSISIKNPQGDSNLCRFPQSQMTNSFVLPQALLCYPTEICSEKLAIWIIAIAILRKAM